MPREKQDLNEILINNNVIHLDNSTALTAWHFDEVTRMVYHKLFLIRILTAFSPCSLLLRQNTRAERLSEDIWKTMPLIYDTWRRQ